MTLITREDFLKVFDTFEHTAFRLEMRERYNEPYEQENFGRFLAGERPRYGLGDSWLASVRQATVAGRRFARVRVIGLPPSDYSRYGLWSSEENVEAGEDIRYLTRDQAGGLPDYDYWMFDSTTVVRFHHDADDRSVGRQIIEDPAEVVRHNHWRDAAWHHAVPRGDFVTQHQLRLD